MSYAAVMWCMSFQISDDMDNVDDCLDFADDSETRIVLNVGGVSHVTLLSTLASKPNTRLYELARSHVIGSDDDEYFFNRHPRVFNSVIDFYRSGLSMMLCTKRIGQQCSSCAA